MARPAQTDNRERHLILKLKQERLRQGLSADKLAAAVGISRTTITNLEANDARPTLWVLLKLCDGLKVNLKDLLP
jgi:DNA-binding XRE family transcriptional regulator